MSASYLRKYGTGTGADIYINIPKAGSANHAVNADWTPAAGDVKISKDGGAAANITTLPTAVAMGNSAIWKFVFSDAELQAAFISVTISDSATKAVDDTGFSIETYGNASALHAFDLDTATQKVDLETIKTQSVTCAAGVTVLASVGTAATSTAQTGDAFARLGAPAGASVSADVAAVKAETAAILDDTGTTGVEIAANALDAAALAADAVDEIKAAIAAITITELASIPAASPSLIQAIALVYMAIRNKRDTDSTGGTDEIHNDAGTVIGTATVSDSGTLFSKGKYA